jgi:hypothetical protein
MAFYLIAFNDEWVPDLTPEELRNRGTAGQAVTEEMTAAGAFVFSDGGLDPSTAVIGADDLPPAGSGLAAGGPRRRRGARRSVPRARPAGVQVQRLVLMGRRPSRHRRWPLLRGAGR